MAILPSECTRNPKAVKYDAFSTRLREELSSPSAKMRAEIQRQNDELCRLHEHVGTSIGRGSGPEDHVRAVGPSDVHVARTLSTVSVQYANADYIGEMLMPMVSAPRIADKYFIYSKRDRLAAPDDTMSARGSANEVDESRSTDTYSMTGYALKDYVDMTTLQNQDAPLNEMIDATESVAEAIALKTEMRIASVLCTSANYATGNTAAAGTKWDTASGGSIIKDIQDARATCWSGRGPGDFMGFCSIDLWNVIARNPAFLELFKYTQSGLTKTQRVAAEFGLKDIMVGEARKDTANKGQAASYSRVWTSTVFGIVRVARSPGIRNAAFGYSFRLNGATNSRQWFDNNIGTDGGYYTQVSKHEVQKVVASDTGYLVTACT